MKNEWLRLVVVAGLALAAGLACASSDTSSTSPDNTGGGSGGGGGGGAPQWGVQTKTSGCVGRGPQGALPDPACTPGDILPDATKDKICVSGYSSTVRNVPSSEKDAVYAEYGISHHITGQYEVDHFVSLELGGSNDISNLWPEPADPTPGFHQKDKVENYLHEQVCSGAMSLADAQRTIATNWLDVFNRLP